MLVSSCVGVCLSLIDRWISGEAGLVASLISGQAALALPRGALDNRDECTCSKRPPEKPAPSEDLAPDRHCREHICIALVWLTETRTCWNLQEVAKRYELVTKVVGSWPKDCMLPS